MEMGQNLLCKENDLFSQYVVFTGKHNEMSSVDAHTLLLMYIIIGNDNCIVDTPGVKDPASIYGQWKLQKDSR